jgi:hypothetical protein
MRNLFSFVPELRSSVKRGLEPGRYALRNYEFRT